ncbi:MAG: CHAT domain-containing protein [Planctomycetota bacterium]|nr:CHAT domain-containing protein [Planctomycetota bacterium]
MRVGDVGKLGTKRGATGGIIDLPAYLPVSAGQTRGPIGWIAKRVKRLVFKPPSITELAADGIAELGAIGIVKWIERESIKTNNQTPGVYQVAEDFAMKELGDSQAVENLRMNSDQPYLVLIHGTFSNARDAFQGFRTFGKDDKPNGETLEWKELCKRYDGRVLALEHKTLSADPVSNAIELGEKLPHNAQLHLISHSRGGLVGDLLSLPELTREQEECFRWKRAGKHFEKSPDEEIAAIRELLKLRAERKWRVTKFVRVASPSQGTILASERLDDYIKVFFNLAKLIPALAASPMFAFLEALAVALAGKRTDPDVIPGVEAMMPESPYIHLLNSTSTKIDDGLAVIAGDVEGKGLFGSLKVFATDLFYREDHDLIVNTKAMYGGLPRKRAIASFQKSSEISHTTYFQNEVTRQRLLNALIKDWTLDNPARGFQALRSRDQKVTVDNVTRGGKKVLRPRLIVIPAQLATRLNYGGENAWPDRIASHGVKLLEKELEVGEIDAGLYNGLIGDLSKSYDVQTFGFDWRKPIAESGTRLVALVEELLKADATTPVHVVAHSGGGFIALWLKANNGALRRQLSALNSRMVLLGLPHSGSLHVLAWMLGQGPLVRSLALLDPRATSDDIAQTFTGFKGLVELLPDIEQQNFLDSGTWKAIGRTAPSELSEARELRAKLLDACQDDYTSVICGEGVATLVAYDHEKLQESERRFLESRVSDGFVLPSDAFEKCKYYVRSDHAGLAATANVIAITTLLEQGSTDQLRTEPLLKPSVFDAPHVAAMDDPVLFPSGHQLVRAALGGEHQPAATDGTTLRIEVVHGSISESEHPVMVGHYEGTPLGGAEKSIDEQFGGLLATRLAIRQYPEHPSQSLFIPGPECEPPGAIIVGMGKSGELTTRRLMQAVTSGVLTYALKTLDEKIEGADVEHCVDFSTVLLGSHGNGLPVDSSISAVINGTLEANAILKNLGMNVRIGGIQFTERYRDLALKAFATIDTVLDRIWTDDRVGVQLESAPVMKKGEDGREGSPGEDYDVGSWSRLEIRSVTRDDHNRLIDEHSRLVEELQKCGDERSDSEREKVLKDWRLAADWMRKPRLEFTSFGRRSRVEVYEEDLQERNIMGLIRDAIATPELTQTSNTLFERLIPNEFKEEFRDGENRVLVLDERSAVIPWEMLAYRDGEGRLVPIIKHTGMMRQLRIEHPIETINTPRGSHALVIGDPDCPPWPRLESAQREARRVADTFKRKGYQVKALISTEQDSPSWLDIENALFEREYRIVHIAAHGQYTKENPEESGVVIGSDTDGNYFLAAQTIGKLSVVPDFVFLNCCHLGRTDESFKPDESTAQQPWNELAASISIQLMKIGVKAVIAAGWGVEDQAAEQFAIKLYQALFDGKNLGDAVHSARNELMKSENKGNSNTWGAYQCYGDPGFRLTKAASSSERATSERGLQVRVRRIAESAKHSYGQENAPAWEVCRLKCLKELAELATSSNDWLSASVTFGFGKAYFELGDYETAHRWFSKSEKASGADASIELVAQISNLEVRLATRMHRNEKASATENDSETEIDKLFKSALTRLEKFELFHDKSSELSSIFGSLYKKRATFALNAKQRNADMKDSRSRYLEASDLAVKEKGDERYSAINAITLGKLLRVSTKTEEPRLRKMIEDGVRSLRQAETETAEFWDRVALPDAMLAVAIVDGNLDSEMESIQEHYDAVFQADSTPRERGSVLEHLSDLQRLKPNTQLAQSLERLFEALRGKYPN